MLKLSLRIALLLPLALVLIGCATNTLPPPPPDEAKQTRADEDDCCPLCAAAKEKSPTGGGCCDGCDQTPVSSDKEEKGKDAKVALKTVKTDELLKAIGSHKGKVVVVD